MRSDDSGNNSIPVEAAVPANAVGNLVDFAAGQVLLPSFIETRDDGLYVAPEVARLDNAFLEFAARVFAAGARFAGLEYKTFLLLAYGLEEMPPTPARFASSIVLFPDTRRALYRRVKIAPDLYSAEYMFEPVELEVEEKVELLGEPDANGSVAVLGHEIRKHAEAAQLDFDEFVAALWEKGVRFGIDESAVRAAVASRQAQRLEVARAVPPTDGEDASIEEKTPALHRDNAPKILPDGRVDLRQFTNRFPQVAADTRLLQKIPRRLGKPGRDVAGTLLESGLPKDFDIAPLAGSGTRVEKGAVGEFIVAARDGFISIDAATNQISVTEKIVSHEGVSMKATGDVVLTGDEFEEHGEVQERRSVEGHHMSFFAAVYGNVISRGGRILLKNGIAGGEASSPGGTIVVEGRASRATLEARGGEVTVEFAEGCAIVGSKVRIGHAVNCDILGEEVSIGSSEGCAIAGKAIHIEHSAARKEIETIVAILTPDLARHEHDRAGLEKGLQETDARCKAVESEVAGLLQDAGLRQYMALAATIAKGGMRLSGAQETKWRQTQASFAPQLRTWQALQKKLAEAQEEAADLKAQLAELAERKSHVGDGITCVIDEVRGDTLVRRMAFQPDQAVVGGPQAREIASHLREYGVSSDRLFWASSGSFAWSYAPPEETGISPAEAGWRAW